MGSTSLQKDRGGLCFFGQISAAISHDLKNVLAIINEDAGLLQDYSLMAAQGMELDPERMAKLAAKVQGQVKRGDEIIKNMNRFAHSVDLSECEVDYRELIALVVSLLTRMASRKCVTVSIQEGEPVKGKGDPFTIQMLIAKVLESAMDSAEKDGELVIKVSTSEEGSVITVSGLREALDEDRLAELGLIADNAGADVSGDPQKKTLNIKF
ncbi:sensor histidine kinase [Maridesulfovibrio sp.]|uniref:sensor histidine kinase n=1 Tax=Maridesulfovibrio sp. TaxID=2795000 RepID=UPI0029F4F09D|nr:sensor histidine kinase [Maridesulfovibrio sp.]